MKPIVIALFLIQACVIKVLLAQESIVGIGVALGRDNTTGDLKIVKVIEGGPASNAGLKAGLLLRKVDDVTVTRKPIPECVPLLRGTVGSKVKLELLDPGDDTIKRFEVTRDKIMIVAPVRAKRGDPAAPLKIKEWAKGGPVDPLDGKNVYVVEFWATWCGPCRVSIPHLSELQKQFKDKGVVIIGISDEDPAKVKPFVTMMGDKMNYIVGCDDDHQTFLPYMDAYGHNGIPTAFVVDKKGKVVWDGHPMNGLDRVIEAVLAGEKPQ